MVTLCTTFAPAIATIILSELMESVFSAPRATCLDLILEDAAHQASIQIIHAISVQKLLTVGCIKILSVTTMQVDLIIILRMTLVLTSFARSAMLVHTRNKVLNTAKAGKFQLLSY